MLIYDNIARNQTQDKRKLEKMQMTIQKICQLQQNIHIYYINIFKMVLKIQAGDVTHTVPYN